MYIETVLLRRKRESESPFNQVITEEDLGSEFNFSGTVQLKRVLSTSMGSDTGERVDSIEYVFDITEVGSFNVV